MNTKRNSSHRNNHVRPGDASAKIARKPASVSRMSHWKDQKSWPAVEIERYRINRATRQARRKKPRTWRIGIGYAGLLSLNIDLCVTISGPTNGRLDSASGWDGFGFPFHWKVFVF